MKAIKKFFNPDPPVVDNSKKTEECDPDAVCAYEYKGKLYRSKVEVQRAKRQQELQAARGEVYDVVSQIVGNRHYHSDPSRVTDMLIGNVGGVLDKIKKYHEVFHGRNNT